MEGSDVLNGLITNCRKENNDFGFIEPHWLTEIGRDLAGHGRKEQYSPSKLPT